MPPSRTWSIIALASSALAAPAAWLLLFGPGPPIRLVSHRRPGARASATHVEVPTLPPGRRTRIVFNIANVGPGVLAFGKPEPTCGCAPPSLARDRLGPGEEAALTVDFRPVDPGPFAHAVDLPTNDPARPNLRFTFAGRAEWPIECSPRSLALSAVAPSSPGPGALEIFSVSGAPFEVTKVVPSDDRITVEEEPGAGPHRRKFRVGVSGLGPGAKLAGTVLFGTSDVGRPEIVVPLDCEIASPARIAPARAMLKATGPGATVRQKFLVFDPGHVARADASVTSSNADWIVRGWRVQRSPAHLVYDVELRIPDAPGYSRSTIQIADGEAADELRSELSVYISEDQALPGPAPEAMMEPPPGGP